MYGIQGESKDRSIFFGCISTWGRLISHVPGTKNFGLLIERNPILGAVYLVATAIFILVPYRLVVEKAVCFVAVNLTYYVGFMGSCCCGPIIDQENNEQYSELIPNELVVIVVVIVIWAMIPISGHVMPFGFINGVIYFYRGLNYSYKEPSIMDNHNLHL